MRPDNISGLHPQGDWSHVLFMQKAQYSILNFRVANVVPSSCCGLQLPASVANLLGWCELKSSNLWRAPFWLPLPWCHQLKSHQVADDVKKSLLETLTGSELSVILIKRLICEQCVAMGRDFMWRHSYLTIQPMICCATDTARWICYKYQNPVLATKRVWKLKAILYSI